jgi:hypothetical protein
MPPLKPEAKLSEDGTFLMTAQQRCDRAARLRQASPCGPSISQEVGGRSRDAGKDDREPPRLAGASRGRGPSVAQRTLYPTGFNCTRLQILIELPGALHFCYSIESGIKLPLTLKLTLGHHALP